MPIFYILGWLIVQPLFLLPFPFQQNDISLLGTFLTFILFVTCLPSWIKFRWGKASPWEKLGILTTRKKLWFKDFVKGFSLALFLLVILLISLFMGGWCEWVGVFNSSTLINAILLGIGVGFAEELVFRGWLWGEIHYLTGSKHSVFVQAVIFSLAHIRFKLGVFELMSLLIGLFLLGLLLAIRRILDKGSLVGSMGLHGGLVGGWFLLNGHLIKLSKNAPFWISGPGNPHPNPIGGLVSIVLLIFFILVFYRTAFDMLRFPFSGERNASAKGAIP